MRIAIMQPTYLPWSGYFGLLDSVDLFVFLDSVQFDKRSWQQRNRIKTPNGIQWLTVPVLSKGKISQRINEVQIDSSAKFSIKHKKSIFHSYNKAPFYNEASEILFPLLDSKELSILKLNFNMIKRINSYIGITTETVLASDIGCTGSKSGLLASICSHVGASEYISTLGSKVYLDESSDFSKIDVPVKYFHFKHPKYPQLFGEFIDSMSIVDMLMNCGMSSRSLIKGGSKIV